MSSQKQWHRRRKAEKERLRRQQKAMAIPQSAAPTAPFTQGGLGGGGRTHGCALTAWLRRLVQAWKQRKERRQWR